MLTQKEYITKYIEDSIMFKKLSALIQLISLTICCIIHCFLRTKIANEDESNVRNVNRTLHTVHELVYLLLWIHC